MIDFKLAHTLKELNDLAGKGYEFVAVINPDSWLVKKGDGLVSLDAETSDTLTIEKETEESIEDHGLRTDTKNPS